MNFIVKLAKLPARRKIIISSFLSSFVFILLCTPIIAIFTSVLTTESKVEYSYEQAGGILKIDFLNIDSVLGTNIILKYKDGFESTIALAPNIPASQTINIAEVPFTVEIYENDQIGKSFQITTISIEDLNQTKQDGNVLIQIDSQNNPNILRDFVPKVGILFFIILFLGFFAISHDLVLKKSFLLAMYSSIVMAPLGLLSLSISFSDPNLLSLVFSIISLGLVFIFLMYFVLLDVNILNISQKLEMPLEQAGRAAQFIFTLLSSYAVLILFFGANFNFFEKLLIIIPFIFVITLLSLYSPRDSSLGQSVVKSLSISLAIAVGVFVFSIWPVNFIYAILSIAVIFYILLSLGMEFRTRLPRQVYYEYISLAIIIVFLLLINSVWGILGPII